MCVCVCVCECVYMCVCMCICVYLCMCVCGVCVYICVCVCVCVCVWCVCVCVWCRDEDADIKHTRAPLLSVSFAKTPSHHLSATTEMAIKTTAGSPTGLLKKFAEGASGLEHVA